MKKVFFMLVMIAGVTTFTSCNQRRESAVQEVTTPSTPEVTVQDEIVRNSVTDDKGNVMHLTFNNTKGSLDIDLNGENITLMQDTTASGLKFSNEQYVYEEWHGEITLTKDGTVVFKK